MCNPLKVGCQLKMSPMPVEILILEAFTRSNPPSGSGRVGKQKIYLRGLGLLIAKVIKEWQASVRSASRRATTSCAFRDRIPRRVRIFKVLYVLRQKAILLQLPLVSRSSRIRPLLFLVRCPPGPATIYINVPAIAQSSRPSLAAHPSPVSSLGYPSISLRRLHSS